MKTINVIFLIALSSVALNSCILEHEEPDPPLNYYYSPAKQLSIISFSTSSVRIEWLSAQGNYSGGIPSTYGSFHPKANIVERSTNSGSFDALITLSGDSTIFVDTQLDSAKSYSYRIRSIFNDTVSTLSDPLLIRYGPSFYITSTYDFNSWDEVYDISPDETKVASLGDDGKLHILNLPSLSEVKSISMSVSDFEYSSNNFISVRSGYYDTLIHTTIPMLNIYKLNDGSVSRSLKSHKFISSFRMSNDEKYIVTGGENPSLAIWSLQDSSVQELYPDSIAVARIDISPDGSLIAATSLSNAPVYLLKSSDGSILYRLNGTFNGFLPVSFSKDGRYLASAGYGKVVCWNVQSGAKTIEIVNPKYLNTDIYVIAVNSNYIFTGDGSGTILVWKLSDGSLFGILKGHSKVVFRLKLSSDGKTLYSLGRDKMNTWSLEPKNNWNPDFN